MQVSHKNDHITHVAISQHKPIQLQMAQSAEFFQVLFKSLYKYPTVAMVREVLCNAWDAHIEAGNTSLAVEIMLDHDYLTVRDFGKGIPAEDMGIRYCVMGGSTKAGDETVTGGFGLGCKAPFAVTDHFEVTSMNGGMKTIYNLSRSSGAVEGIPGCLAIVSIPTTETGLEVKIPVRGIYGELEKIIKRVVFGGGINANLNGVELERLPLSLVPGSWVITRMPTLAFAERNQRNVEINIRYGNVIYPGADLEHHMHSEYRQMFGFLEKVGKFVGKHSSTNICLVLQADPGTLSVTPSRETLSMVPKTVEKIKQLFTVVHAKLMEDTIPVAFEAVKDTVQAAVQSRDVRALTCVYHVPPHPQAQVMNNQRGTYYSSRPEDTYATRDLGAHFNSVSELGKSLIHSPPYYGSVRGLRQSDLRERLRLMIQEGLLDRGTLQSFGKLLRSRNPAMDHAALHNWFRRTIVGRLSSAMFKHPYLNHTKLFVPRFAPYGGGSHALMPAKSWVNGTSSALHYLKFVRKIVILAHSQELITFNMSNLPDAQKIGGYGDCTLAYIVGRDEKHISAARYLFERHGYVIVDMTTTQPWMELPPKYVKELNKKPRVRKASKPKQGFMPLSKLLDREQGEDILRAIRSTGEVPERVLKPKGVLQLDRETFGERHFRLKGFTTKSSILAAKLYGADIGVVVNSVALDLAHEKKGFIPGERFILDELLREMTTNRAIQTYLPLRFEESTDFRILRQTDAPMLVRLLVRYQPAAKKFGVQNSLTQRDRDILKLWNWMTETQRSGYHAYYPELKACPVLELDKKLDAIPMDPRMTALLKWVYAESNTWRLIDVPAVARTLIMLPINDEQKFEHKLAHKLLLEILKGV